MAIRHLLRTSPSLDWSHHLGGSVRQPLSGFDVNISSFDRWDSPASRLRPLIRLGLVGLVCANLLFTTVTTFLSVHNYPGGEVWKALDKLQNTSNDTR
jgi:hypothetical protein